MKIEFAGLVVHTNTTEEAFRIIDLCAFHLPAYLKAAYLKGGQPTYPVNVTTSDSQTHNLLTSLRDELRKINVLLTLQMKGESTFMADITSDLQDLKDAVTAETDQDAAIATAIDGAVNTMAQGVAEIKALAQQIGTVADDPDMVRGLAAKIKSATATQAEKLAALQAASGDLAAAVTANTTSGAAGVSGASGVTGSSGTGVTGSDTSSSVSAGGTAPASSESGTTAGSTTGNDTASPTSQEDVNAASGASSSTATADTGPTLDPSGGQGSNNL
jgi:hypothetical protein